MRTTVTATPSRTIARESRPRRRCRGVSGGFASAVRLAIVPTSVSAPVAVTSARARPRVAPVPAKTIDVRSARAVSRPTAAALLAIGRDSPVRADSSSSEALGVDQAAVGGDAIPFAHEDQVARHELLRGNLALAPVPHDRSRPLDGATKCDDRPLRPRLLDEAQHAVEDDDERDHSGLDVLADGERDRRRCDQQGDEWVGELPGRDRDVGRSGRGGQAVRPYLCEPRFGSRAAQTALGIGPELAGELLRHAGVSVCGQAHRSARIPLSACRLRVRHGPGRRGVGPYPPAGQRASRDDPVLSTIVRGKAELAGISSMVSPRLSERIVGATDPLCGQLLKPVA